MTFKPTEEQQAIIDYALTGDNLIVQAYAGCGKAQPIHCVVKTPTGDKTLKDICVGDSIFKKDGSIGKVIGKFPQGIQETYKLTFRDGSSTFCNSEHLWTFHVLSTSKKGSMKTVSLKDVINEGLRNSSGYKWKIPLCEPVQYEEKVLPIHPYIVGFLIGDGCLLKSPTQVTIGNKDIEAMTFIENLLPKKYKLSCRETETNCVSCNIVSNEKLPKRENSFTTNIRKLGLNVKSAEKFIPSDYLYSSIEQRTWLLKGLMDSDGNCCKNRTRFNSNSKTLIDNVVELVQSLGGTCIRNKEVTNRVGQYSVNVKTFFNPFHIKSKADLWSFSSKNPPSRFLIKIEKVECTEQVCIAVDSKDHLYLTDEFIVTHNTSSVVLVAKALQTQNKRGMYFAFNKDIATEAKSKMPSNVECSTVHSLAYRNTDKKLINKLKYKSIFPSQLAEKYGIDFFKVVVKTPMGDIEDKVFSPTQILTMVKNTVKMYCNSADDGIEKYHVAIVDTGHTTIVQGLSELANLVLKYAKMHWKDVINHKSETPLTHDAYLKLYSMSDCKLNVDFLMVDEAQDVNPCILKIIERQECQKILVGDDFQSIYQWRGAVNAMELFTYKRLYLTKTFRFGEQMSALANAILSYSGAEKPLIDNGDKYKEYKKTTYDCYIYRTNQGALEMYIQLLNDGVKPYLNVNVDEIKQFVQHYFGLDKGWDIKRPHPLLTGFNKTSEVIAYLDENDDVDLAKFVNLCINNGYGIIHKLDNMPNIHLADCIIMTAHKSKGLEYDSVFIGDDFQLVYENENNELVVNDNPMELNLVYVAVTRAKKHIDCVNLKPFFLTITDGELKFR